MTQFYSKAAHIAEYIAEHQAEIIEIALFVWEHLIHWMAH